jgi:hypothetical protein
MKTKAFVEGIVTGIVAGVVCYRALSWPALHAAIAIRRKMPEAWFSSFITWYAIFAVIGLSIVVAGIVCRKVYKVSSAPEE